MKPLSAPWLAGFFDGEGCVGTARIRGAPRVRITITQRDREILDHIRQYLGYGTVIPTTNGAFRYRIHSQEDVDAFIQLLYPYVIGKKDQLKLAQKIVRMRSKPGVALGPELVEEREQMHRQLSQLKGRP